MRKLRWIVSAIFMMSFILRNKTLYCLLSNNIASYEAIDLIFDSLLVMVIFTFVSLTFDKILEVTEKTSFPVVDFFVN